MNDTELVEKSERVIASCLTVNQLRVATAYTQLVINRVDSTRRVAAITGLSLFIGYTGRKCQELSNLKESENEAS
jgi:hypothetical protein